MEALKLHWLGLPRVELKGRPAKLETRKSLALLAYVSMGAEKCQREGLAAIFWPEATQQRALGNLRRTLSSLNSRLPGCIESDRETIGLKRGSALWSDVAVFRDLLARAKCLPDAREQDPEKCRSLLEGAVKLYRGDFLEGLVLADAPQFDEWQFFECEVLRRELAGALESLSHLYSKTRRSDQAIESALRWAALDPLREPACRTLMELYAASGNRSAALRQYEELKHLLGEQQRDPEEQTRLLYEHIRGPQLEAVAMPAPDTPIALPILKTKLYIPTAPASRVERTALLDRLREMEHYRLTLISAPAGFGKTTLLAEWIERTSFPVAWLSLDQADNDPYRFLSYLIEALQGIHEDVGAQARQLMQTSQPALPHIILASVINDLGKSPKPGMLVLDDYQSITDSAVHESVGYLLDHLPANLHVVIASRADPPLRLGRLRAHGQMLELRTHDLRFTAAEAAEFLNGVMSLRLSSGHIQALEAKTEGWVVGLQLAALSLKDHGQAADFIRAFSGSNRFILDYLVEEVLKRQPARIETFLLQTSVLDKLGGPLCDALMGQEWHASGEGSQAVLEHLERSNLFVVSLDDEGQWYRYHHLFADLLRSRLSRSQPAEVTTLHRKASAWHEANGLFAEAIEHALDAQDMQAAARLVEKHAGDLVFAGRYTTALEWIQRLPPEYLQESPWLSVWLAWSILASGKIEGVRRLIQQARAGLPADGSEPPDFPQHSGERLSDLVLGLEMTLASLEERHSDTVMLASQLLDRLPDTRSRHRMNALYTMGNAYFATGELSRAEQAYQEVKKTPLQTWLLRHILATHRLASIQRIRADLGQSSRLYEELITSLERTGQQDSFGTSYVYEGLAALCNEWNRPEEARGMSARSLQLAEMTRVPMILADACSHAIPLLIGIGDLEAAAEMREKAARLMEKYPVLPETRDLFESGVARLLLARQDLNGIAAWVERRKRSTTATPTFSTELGNIGLARALIALDDLEAANRLLKGLAAAAETGGRNGRLVEIYLLQARVLWLQGRKRAALASVKCSLALGEPGDYLRTYIDEGQWLRELLTAVLEAPQPDALPSRAYIGRLLDSLDSIPASLSARELS